MRNQRIRKLFRNLTEITIITKEGGCGWFSEAQKLSFSPGSCLRRQINIHRNVTGPSTIHLQPSVHGRRPSPSGTKALKRKRLSTHADKGKIICSRHVYFLGT